MADGAFADALRLLGRVIVAAEPYADDLLVIGGMVPLLYRRATGFSAARFEPPGTTEVDMSVPRRLTMGLRPIRELLEEAGLVAFNTPGYRDQPGAQSFQDQSHGTIRKAPTYVEFLAPLLGKGNKPLVEVQPGFPAEALRYLDLLAFEPIVLQLADMPDLGIVTACRLRVPQPALYVAQKILARSSGRLKNRAKAAKDLAYAFDVAVLSRPLWAAQGELVARAAAEDNGWRKWLQRAGRELRSLFGSPTADGPVEAALIFRDLLGKSAPTEEEIQAVVTRFVEQVFEKA